MDPPTCTILFAAGGWSSNVPDTPTMRSPNPSANRISVLAGANVTMRVGALFRDMVTPSSSVTVMGNDEVADGAAAGGLGRVVPFPHAARARATARVAASAASNGPGR